MGHCKRINLLGLAYVEVEPAWASIPVFHDPAIAEVAVSVITLYNPRPS